MSDARCSNAELKRQHGIPDVMDDGTWSPKKEERSHELQSISLIVGPCQGRTQFFFVIRLLPR